MSEERRSSHRYKLWLPARIENGSKSRRAVGHGISEGGALWVTNHRSKVGARLRLSLQLPTQTDTQAMLHATVLRCDSDAADPDGLWPYRIAVRFDELAPRLLEQHGTQTHLLVGHSQTAKQT